MKKNILFSVCICWVSVLMAQTGKSPIAPGHYKTNETKGIYFNIFDNGRVSLVSSDPHDDFLFQAYYIAMEDKLKLHTDDSKRFLTVYTKKDSQLPQEKVRFIMDPESRDLDDIYVSLSSDVSNPQWVNVDSLYEENDRSQFYFDVNKKGNVLLFKYERSRREFFYRYTLPAEDNQVFFKISRQTEDAMFDFITVKPGANPNQITLSIDVDKDSIDLYYLRPINDTDPGGDVVSQIYDKPGYTFQKQDEVFVRKINRRDDNYSSSEGEPIRYQTNYQQALQEARSKNKILRVYAYPTKEDTRYTSLKEVLDNNFNPYYYGEEILNFFKEKYVLLLLAGEETKVLDKFKPNSDSGCLFISSDEHLLYRTDFDSDYEVYVQEDQYPNLLYAALLMYYNNLVIEPQISKTKSPDKKLLDKYMDNIFWVVDSTDYYGWDDYYQSFTQEFPKSLPTFQKLSMYVEQYAELQMKSKPDTMVAQRILRYYEAFEDQLSEETLEVLPPSFRYILQNTSVLRKSSLVDPDKLFYFIQKRMPHNSYDEVGKISTQTAVKLYKEAITLAPEYKDFLIMDYWEYVAYRADFEEAYEEAIGLMSDYFKDVLKAPKLKKYFNHLSHQMYEIAPSAFTDRFESETQYFYPDDTLTGKLHQQIALILNNTAWNVYNHYSNGKYLSQALQWSKLSLDMHTPSQYIYMDTYAHLLYRSGKKEEAMTLQREALQMATENDADEDISRQIRLDLKLMELDLLGKEDQILDGL